MFCGIIVSLDSIPCIPVTLYLKWYFDLRFSIKSLLFIYLFMRRPIIFKYYLPPIDPFLHKFWRGAQRLWTAKETSFFFLFVQHLQQNIFRRFCDIGCVSLYQKLIRLTSTIILGPPAIKSPIQPFRMVIFK